MKYVLGIDFGGGASKATLLSQTGIAAESMVEYPTLYPAPGQVEQNPDDWFSAACQNIKAVLSKANAKPEDILAVACDAPTHTAVLMDADFNILRNAIYWTDTRSIEEVAFLKENHQQTVLEQALHAPDTIWTLPELLWVKNHEPQIWSRVRRVLFAKDYVRHCLTGDYVTDCIEAEGSMLYDTRKGAWSEALCGVLGLPTEYLPPIVKPNEIVGKVTAQAAERTGLAAGTPVLCGTTDTVMEILAAGAVEKGQMTLKLATAGRICVITDAPYPQKHIINYSHVVDGLYYPGTATKSCASAYRWYRDTFGGGYAELDSGAESIPVGSEGLVFHPYLNGELTPYANPKLCADFVGVRASHTKAHFTRAVLEGVAMSMRDCMEELGRIGIPHEKTAIIIGGGGKSPLWRQILSDALGMTLISKRYADSSLGSAMLAAVAVGMFESYAQAQECCNAVVAETHPRAENTRRYDNLFARYKAVQKALEAIYNEDSCLC